jgi:ABC-type Zn2+ transport system substrate-binding protein/surface adhesin
LHDFIKLILGIISLTFYRCAVLKRRIKNKQLTLQSDPDYKMTQYTTKDDEEEEGEYEPTNASETESEEDDGGEDEGDEDDVEGDDDKEDDGKGQLKYVNLCPRQTYEVNRSRRML